MTGTIRILIADDHPVVRDGLTAMLATQDDFEVVGEAADGTEAVALVGRHEPDVVLMDLRMPHLGGLDAARMIRQALPETQVVLFTVYDDQALTEAGARAGVFAYLVKGCPPGQVVDVVQQAWQWKRGLEISEVKPPAG